MVGSRIVSNSNKLVGSFRMIVNRVCYLKESTPQFRLPILLSGSDGVVIVIKLNTATSSVANKVNIRGEV